MKKRVLLISSGGLDKSGVPSVIMSIVRGMSEECTFDILLHTDKEGYFEQEFLSCGGKIFRFNKKKYPLSFLNRLAELVRPIALYGKTRRLLRENGPYDVLHCHNDFDMAGCLAAGAKENVPVRVGHTHKTWNTDGGLVTRTYRRLCRRVINRRATVRAGCSQVANRRFYGENIASQVVYDAYRDDQFVFDPDAAAPGNAPTVIQVGYFCDNKNQLFTLNVFRRLAEKLPQARLCFVGADQGNYGKTLREEAARLGLKDRVEFLPPDADLPAVLRKSALMLFPSKAEGFGIVLIEAQASGLYCYASDVVPRETNVGGVSYLPLSAGPDAWAEAILSEQKYRHKTRYDCSKFSMKAFLDSIRRIYGLS